jgi:hypothetical protein
MGAVISSAIDTDTHRGVSTGRGTPTRASLLRDMVLDESAQSAVVAPGYTGTATSTSNCENTG